MGIFDMGTFREEREKRREKLKNALDNLTLPSFSPKFKKTSPYAWIVKQEFEDMSEMLEEVNFKTICEHLITLDILPKNGDAHKLGQAYRREKNRRQKNNTSDTAPSAPASPSVPERKSFQVATEKVEHKAAQAVQPS